MLKEKKSYPHDEFMGKSYSLKEGDIIKEGDFYLSSNNRWKPISSKFYGQEFRKKLGTISPEIRRLASNSIKFIMDID